MAKKRNLKRQINYICSDLFAETMAAALYGAKVDMEAVDDTLATILVLRNDFIKRISHPEPGMEAKLFYKSIIKDFNLQVSDIIDKIGNLG
ncbi:MAG: hypothetical protein SPL67_03030 [Prevotella sp.]|nr:hypothetical protein [Prevotella sp.]MDY6241081.1 hypothetical protein [Prevotella sp.]